MVIHQQVLVCWILDSGFWILEFEVIGYILYALAGKR